MTSPAVQNAKDTHRLFWASNCVVLGSLIQAVNLQTLLEQQWTATALMSSQLWQAVVSMLGGEFVPGDGQVEADLDLPLLLFLNACFTCVFWLGGAALISHRSGRTWRQSLADWGILGWLWCLLPLVWESLNILEFLLSWEALELFLLATPQVWVSLSIAGWLATLFSLCRRESPQRVHNTWHVPMVVWMAIGMYVVVFTIMNWQLYRAMLIPHGDSAMYEEHLWNLTHGKGFRSYLDPGLFWGEHIQFVHLLLIPLHLFWPSHLMLELSETLALASGAIPVFWMARRHSLSNKSATLLACAYLLYVPLQFLDIAIDLKTFRPTSFGVPLLLFALDQLERGRLLGMTILLLVTTSAKEDYAIIIAGLGVWLILCRSGIVGDAGSGEIATNAQLTDDKGQVSQWHRVTHVRVGSAMAFLAIGYVAAVVTILVPYFREGLDPHYTRYFGELGNTPGDIAKTALKSPMLVLRELFSVRSSIYVLSLLMPLGFLSLLSPTRLLTGLPLFSILCLMRLSRDTPLEALIPFHHFHAPLIPVVFWAAAAGLGNVGPLVQRTFGRWLRGNDTKLTNRQQGLASFAPHCAWTSALVLGVFLSLSPLGLRFWDSGSLFHYQRLYIIAKRATLFQRVFEKIPIDARVASTDHVHTRFTHHERSYDYSEQRRKVSDYADKVPDDTEYIVIDTQHHYSKIKRPDQVRELRTQANQWQLLPDNTEGYFIVLKRKTKNRHAE